jgi:hypothetical protein
VIQANVVSGEPIQTRLSPEGGVRAHRLPPIPSSLRARVDTPDARALTEGPGLGPFWSIRAVGLIVFLLLIGSPLAM